VDQFPQLDRLSSKDRANSAARRALSIKSFFGSDLCRTGPAGRGRAATAEPAARAAQLAAAAAARLVCRPTIRGGRRVVIARGAVYAI